tara:strand:- start:418 stop:876 length:459 start_codon:yes stop_codon:yes gene_type:complete
MHLVTELFKKDKQQELFLGIVFILYLILNMRTPSVISQVIDTTFGSVVLLLLALSLFLHVNPIVGVLGLAVAFEMIRRSSVSFGYEKYIPSESKKLKHMKAYNAPNENRFKYTLEQELVSAHDKNPNISYENLGEGEYKPVTTDTKNNTSTL